MSKHEKNLRPLPALNRIFICEKCGGGDSKNLKKSLKSLLKERGLKGNTKAVLTDCMGICPDDGIAVALVSSGNSAPVFLVCPSPEEAEELLNQKQTPDFGMPILRI